MHTESSQPDDHVIDVPLTARRASLSLSEEETARATASLTAFLAYAKQLEALDLDAVEPLRQVHAVANVFRADEVEPSLPHDTVMANAPKSRDGLVIVPKILE